ncbi:HNH endonuclease [Bdellovibrio sp. KM01]|uniref:HNH endonuclease n=1 Tax=Bdellovibrio sp. KM01 TaxID=2748865 RepID=UPI0015E9CE65|nr:HNH endonuclease signature motif containing protein [Bdellovibrio sp. KM01]QLY24337.1 HNH endonuclease [Bdellovibrio sp. KM01]
MDLTLLPSTELLNRVEKLARTERKITHLILWHIVEIESRRLFLDLGYTSLFKYMTAHLHYSEDAAYRRIQAARLLKKVPQVDKAIESGSLNLTQLQNVQKCLNVEFESGRKISAQQTANLLEQIQNKSSVETQKILAVEFDQPIQIHESLKAQRDDSTRMQIIMTEDQMKDLQHAKDLLSHVLPNPSWADLISYLAKAEIKKRLGKDKAEFLNSSEKNQDEKAVPVSEKVVPVRNEKVSLNNGKCLNEIGKFADNEMVGADRGTENRMSQRKYLNVTSRRVLLVKANHCCEFVHKNGERCQSRYQLQVDHKVPLALGGSNDMENFRVLCRTHNLSEARRMGISSH